MHSNKTLLLAVVLIAAAFALRSNSSDGPAAPSKKGAAARSSASVKIEKHIVKETSAAQASAALHKHEVGDDCEASSHIAETESLLIKETPENPADVLARELGPDWKNQFAVTTQDFTDTEGRPTDHEAFLRDQDRLSEQNEQLPTDMVGALLVRE